MSQTSTAFSDIRRGYETVRQIIGFLARREDSSDLAAFYSELHTYLSHILLVLEDVDEATIPPNLKCRLLKQLDSIIKTQDASITTYVTPTQVPVWSNSPEEKIRWLSQGWHNLLGQTAKYRLQGVKSYLSLGENDNDRWDLKSSLSEISEEIVGFDENQPGFKDSTTKYSSDFAPKYRISDLPDNVREAAHKVHDALDAHTSCSCNKSHVISTRLLLSAYRRNRFDLRLRNQDIFHFDLFLSTEEGTWHETRVSYFAKQCVPPGCNRTPARSLCELFTHDSADIGKRFALRTAADKRLFNLAMGESSSEISTAGEAISLEQILTRGVTSLAGKSPYVLSLILAATAFHLIETPWLRPEWSSATVFFPRSKYESVYLRPFIQTQLSPPYDKESPDYSSVDGVNHPQPVLVSLAIMLMEIHLRKPFKVLLHDYNIVRTYEVIDGRNPAVCMDALELLECCKGDLRYSQLEEAINYCLTPQTWCDQDWRAKIYRLVVWNLECALISIDPDRISLDDLDKTAMEFVFMSPGSFCDGWKLVQLRGLTPYAQFFDDQQEISDEISRDKERRRQYKTWKEEHMLVYAKFINRRPKNCATLTPVKVAILDTGIDENHLFLQDDSIKGRRCFTQGNNNEHDVTDIDGHGTFMAGLLLEYVPDIELYIAKVGDKKSPKSSQVSPEVAAEAIKYAVSEWEVDIISMSFGFSRRNIEGYEKLYNAIRNAYSRNVLLFAAASNGGGREQVSFPARHNMVIAVNSTNTFGERSEFSPTARTSCFNFATVGEAVESTWLQQPQPQQQQHSESWKHLSGTSCATPILASIAAFLLLYARIYLPDEAHALKDMESMENVLSKVAEKGRNTKLRDGYRFVHLSLRDGTLFGENARFITDTIQHILLNE